MDEMSSHRNISVSLVYFIALANTPVRFIVYMCYTLEMSRQHS